MQPPQPPHLRINNTLSSSCLSSSCLPAFARVQSTPSPSSSSSSSACSSLFDSPLPAIRRSSQQAVEVERRRSASSMTSWSSTEESVLKPPDDETMEEASDKLANLPTAPALSSHFEHTASDSLHACASTAHSPHEVTTPESDQIDHFSGYFISRNGNTSPASSATSTAPSKGEATPRAELPAPAWPLAAASSPSKNRSRISNEPDDMDIDPCDPGGWQQTLRREACFRRKYASLDASRTDLASTFSLATPIQHSAIQNGFPLKTTSTASGDHDRRTSERSSTSSLPHKVVAQSSATGCRISAPISPPPHYPGSAKQGLRRDSPSRASLDGSDANSINSSNSSDSLGFSRATPPAPRWARPPCHTNAISGRAWSFSQGQERPELDFDPELFDHSEPDAVQEILKGMEGRIAVKTTPTEYKIMAWLPGFAISDITISMKGERTVQIVADLWDEGDHAQWNVLLGEDVDKSAISAIFEGSELRVTVKRKPQPSYRSFRSSYSAPAQVLNAPRIPSALGSSPTSGLATYPRASATH